MKQSVRLSQCMIVKNEEKNIRKALSWAKDIAFEQIVVDTGSTDHTVEIAKEMGARVYHFSWVNDFAAAKNFAIDQAKGDWIAFLDADEYFTAKDAKTLLKILEQLENSKKSTQSVQVVRSKMIHLDDQGKPFSIAVQDRIFRNLPNLRYHGQIHEQLKPTGKFEPVCLNAEETLSIFHTGYSSSAYLETGKTSRNIELLRKALADQPEDYNLWSYLGDSLMVEGDCEQAIDCFRKVLFESPGPSCMMEERFYNAGLRLLRILVGSQQNTDEMEIQSIAQKLNYPDTPNPDIHYYLGNWYLIHEDYPRAKEELETGLQKLERYTGTGTVNMKGNLEQVYIWLAGIYQHLKQPQQVVRYGVLALRMNPWNNEVLTQILILLKEESQQTGDDSATWKFLQKLYNFDHLKDRLFVLKCAKGTGFSSLEDRIFRLLPEDIQERLRHSRPDSGWKEMPNIGIPIRNWIDQQFSKWVLDIQQQTKPELIAKMKKHLEQLKPNPSTYRRYVDYYEKFPLWGTLHPEKEDFQTFELRAASVKEHLDDLIWLYQRLADYRSREVLLAILRSWTEFDIQSLGKVIDHHPAYFDLDLIPSAQQEVFVDVGAYIGDTILKFAEVYGTGYQKILAYEVSPDILPHLRRNAEKLHDVDVRGKGAGKCASSMRIKANEQDASANQVIADSDAERTDTGSQVEIVPLDADLSEPVTWIKMDIEGAEEDALLGCETIIRSHSPKLSICTYHGYEDIWKLPRLIDRMNPSYRFYMRYYGGNLSPTKFVLTALPPE